MSYRIDSDALRRYSADGVLSTVLSPAQQQRFETAIESALESREDAGGPGELNVDEERIFVVEEGDSLVQIADELNVDLNELLDLNQREDIPDPDQIDVGDVVFVPHTSPQEAATSPRNAQGIPEGETDFVQSLRQQGNDLEYADDPSAIDMDAEVGHLATDVQSYVEALPPAERQAALQRLYDNDWVDAGPAQMAIEQAASELGMELGETSHAGPEVESQAREIIDEAQAESDPDKALQILEDAYDSASPAVQSALDRSSAVREIAENSAADFISEAQTAEDPSQALRIYEEGYSNASERVQAALDRSSDGQAIIDDAVEWAAEPMLDDSHDHELPAARSLQAIERLETLTADLPPEFAAGVVDAMLPQLQQAQQNFRDDGYAGVEIGYNGTLTLNSILDRIAGTEKGDAATQQIVEMAMIDMNGVRSAMYQAASEGNSLPALAMELAAHEGTTESFREEVIATAEQFRDQTIGDQSEAYYEHLQELSYLIDTGDSAMTPEQLEAAIEDYIESRGDAWSEELEGLRDDLADSGATLLEHIQQLQSLPNDIRAEYQDRIDALIDDPNAQLAVSTALQENPELVRGEAGDQLVETFNELGIQGDDPLAATLMGTYLNENVLGSMADLDFTDADAMADARQSIEEALTDKPHLAELMGVSTDDLNELATLLSGVLPSEPLPGGNEFGRVNGILRNLNNTLDQIDGKFVRSTPFSTTFRTTAFTIVGSGLINAGYNFLENPNLRNSAELGVALSRVGVDSAQLVAAYSNITDSHSPTVKNLKAAGKFVHIMGATLAAADAVSRFQEGDYWGAGLNAGVAGGVSIALLFGSTSWGGPVGFGIATLASLGLYINESGKEAPYQTQTTTEFLTHAGFSEVAAEILITRSEDGHNAVPLLMRYGELHGLSPEQTVEWINSIPEGDNGDVMLGALRDNLLNTLDQHLENGDVSQFNEHVDEGYELFGPSLGQSRAGELAPKSSFELDAILPMLDIESPQAYA
ncbi:LysM peptidoglycan-binding domain-containing protein [Halomonas huangheensis]|uniref:LysM domain-containing protein n=1 Tax=Halomonas huangheensis TaxID=1178482 RepID=W1N941_9GAMM|nr:LysM domain-containing protein [Halomonas huangheensis]ALM54005.1 hypothetical protein AR456_18285 [Halomonas huangheensis]ERL52033.1 hypothetical protein BJB45_08710 [Halomonas huangheensis]